MKVTYALQPHPRSIFLAGPTPRSPEVQSWRPEAIAILERLGFDGEVIVPESPDWRPHGEYDHQVEWEWAGLWRATVVAFWIPRDLDDMPGFTTNVEFGLAVGRGGHRIHAVLGAPKDAPKLTYLRRLASHYGVPQADTLETCMALAVGFATGVLNI